MNKFTEGEWKAFHRPEAYGQPDIYEIHWSEDGECVAEVVHGEANANVMAAAKDMYEMLERMYNNPLEDPTRYRDKIGEILIKARGEA